MDINKDYYSILGLLQNAEQAVIKAAYKAMLTIHHPDKHLDNKAFAHEKTLEIMEAYKVLSNVDMRSQYDKDRLRKVEENQSTSEEGDAEDSENTDDIDTNYDEHESVYHTLDEDWDLVVKYYSDIDILERKLKILSPLLAFNFRLHILEKKNFETSDFTANRMESEYLEKYFGNNKLIQSFAKELLYLDKRDAAKELNKTVIVIGDLLEPKKVIIQICAQFKIENSKIYENLHLTQTFKKDEIGTKKPNSKTKLDICKKQINYAVFSTLICIFFMFIPHTLGYTIDLIIFISLIFSIRHIYIFSKKVNKIINTSDKLHKKKYL